MSNEIKEKINRELNCLHLSDNVINNIKNGKNGILYKDGIQTIDNNTLTALTLLIAESNPKEKDIIIDLIMNFLNND